MQINDLIQKKNNINVFEDFTNFELEMAKIPDGHTEDGDLTDKEEPINIVYKWDKRLQNWSYNIKTEKTPGQGDRFKNKKWIFLKPQPSEDDEGNPFLDKDGKQRLTKYSRRWRHYVEKAGREIDRKKGDTKPAIETQPIKDKQTFKYGKQEYIYDNKLNLWFNKSTKQKVDKNSLLNATLMANYGFKPDGQRELDPTYKEQFLTWVTKGLPDWLKKGGRLGQDSQVSARNFGGRRGGEIGDLLGRLLIAPGSGGGLPGKITDMLFGPKPKPEQKKGESGDNTTKGTQTRPPGSDPEQNDNSTTNLVPYSYEPIPNDKKGQDYKNLLRGQSTDLSGKRDLSILSMKSGDKAKLKVVNTNDVNVNDIFYYIGQEDSGKPGQWIKGTVKVKPQPNSEVITVMTAHSPAGFPLKSWKMYIPFDSETTPADYNARSKDGAKRDISSFSKGYSGIDKMELRQKIKLAVRNIRFNRKMTPSGQNLFSDPYKMLGLKQDATDQEVDRNFKALSSMYHPDKEGGDEELFKIIVSARDQIIS